MGVQHLRLDSESHRPRAYGFNFIARAINKLVITNSPTTDQDTVQASRIDSADSLGLSVDEDTAAQFESPR